MAKKMGRPTRFSEKMGKKVLELLKKGKTEAEVAKVVGVTRRTIYAWKARNEDFLLSVREAKQIPDEMVEAALFARATGYSHPETKVMTFEGQVITHRVTRHYAPDTQAIMFWLGNRQPKRWKRKNEGDVNVNNNLGSDKLTDAQLEARIEALEAKRKKEFAALEAKRKKEESK